MSNASINIENLKKELLSDKAFQEEYERLSPRYEVISQLITARKEQNITQAELAKKIGTQKSNISRFESGAYNPSLDFLVKVANSLGKKIKIQIY